MNARLYGAVLIAFFHAAATLTSHAQTRLLASDSVNDRLLEINPHTAVATPIGPFNHPFVGKIAWDSTHHVLYGVTSDSTFSVLLTVNPETGGTNIVGPLSVYFMQGLAYDPHTDTLYGVASGSVSRGLYRIDRASGAATRLVAINGFTGPATIALDPVSDVMYLAEIIGQQLRTLNLVTGGTTIIGSFGAPGMPFPQVGIGFAFDPEWGLLATDNTGLPGNDEPLYTVDTDTGHATLIGFTGTTGIAGLAFLPDCPADLDGDWSVGIQDVAILLAHFGNASGADPRDGDLDRDEDVDLQDLAAMLAEFGGGC
jgi:hypothetical protein